MGRSVARQLIEGHLLLEDSGVASVEDLKPGAEIALSIDQTLTQDATGTLVMLELESMDLDRVHTDVSVQYVDHNLLQADFRNPDDHLFLQSACERFGLWYSKPGNGVSHPVHMQRFGVPGASMVGSDSHTCAAGSLGMLAVGVGGLEVAMAMAGEPLYLKMPEIWGVELTGSLPPWVSAKDVVLEMLRRHGVKGGVGRIIEYYGDGLAGLSAMDRHVIANMGAELGATTTVFPADGAVRTFLEREQRGDDFTELLAEADTVYDRDDRIDLGELEPLIARPSSPGDVVPVAQVAGEPVHQVVIGSSANPGLRDFAVVAEIVRGLQSHERVSFDVNPTSRQLLEDLTAGGWLLDLVAAGARIHQSGCLGCIGMGQAPASGRNSLRTMPRNFPGRSGTDDDAVWLCSPETAAAAALTGEITDPRELEGRLGLRCPAPKLPRTTHVNTAMLVSPPDETDLRGHELVKGPNIAGMPEFDPLPDRLEALVELKVGDDVSTDEILPAGAQVLPLRSNIPAIAEHVFGRVDPDYARRAADGDGPHAIIGGENYGQGSSREHAVVAPRYLGLRLVVAKSFARIHWQNLANFGILALRFADPDDYDRLDRGSWLSLDELSQQLRDGSTISARLDGGDAIELAHDLSPRQVEMVLAGGRIAARSRG